jgi:hypothetical protein
MATFERKATKHDEEQMLIIARDMISKNGYVTTEDIRCSRGNYTLSMAKKLFKKLIASGDMRSDGDGGFILLDKIQEVDFDDGFFETREGRIVDDLDMDLKNELKNEFKGEV